MMNGLCSNMIILGIMYNAPNKSIQRRLRRLPSLHPIRLARPADLGRWVTISMIWTGKMHPADATVTKIAAFLAPLRYAAILLTLRSIIARND